MLVTIPSHSTPLLTYPVILCRLLSLARLFAPPILTTIPSTSASLATSSDCKCASPESPLSPKCSPRDRLGILYSTVLLVVVVIYHVHHNTFTLHSSSYLPRHPLPAVISCSSLRAPYHYGNSLHLGSSLAASSVCKCAPPESPLSPKCSPRDRLGIPYFTVTPVVVKYHSMLFTILPSAG